MRHEYENARRHAENTIAEANLDLHRENVRKNPKYRQMLTTMIKDATDTLRNLDAMNDARPYSDTNIGYNADMRQRTQARDDATDTMRNAINAISRILPRVADNMDDMDDRYDNDMDEVVDRRGRPRRTRRGVGRWTQVRTHVRRMPRSDMDDRYDDVEDRYDDVADDMEMRRRSRRTGRFIRGDMDDDMRYEDAADDARRAANEARRMADEARRTADDMRHILPGTPVMPRNDRYARNDEGRNDTRGDARYDARDDDAHRPAGPGMNR